MQTRFFVGVPTAILRVRSYFSTNYSETSTGPSSLLDKCKFLALLFCDPIILSSLVAAFLASLMWMAAMTKFELSQAYPFMSLNFVMTLLLSSWLLNEPITLPKAAGVALIMLGTLVAAHG